MFLVEFDTRYSAPKQYYFAYGLLTDPAIMHGAELVGAAKLKNHRFEFYGFANIVESAGDDVYGALWQLPDGYVSQLDKIEGYPEMYDRRTVPVFCNGQRYEAEVYKMTPHYKEYFEPRRGPSEQYLRRLAKGYNRVGIPFGQLRTAIDELPRTPELAEVAMNPAAYAQSYSQAPKKMLIGFEFEVLVPEDTLERFKPEQPSKPPRSMKEVWRDFKDIINEFNGYITIEDFDSLFRVRGAVRLKVPGGGDFAYYDMEDAAAAFKNSESLEEEAIIKKILKHNNMWTSNDFVLAFKFDPAEVDQYIKRNYGYEDEDDDEVENYSRTVDVLKPKVKLYLSGGREPKVFYSYHEEDKNTRDWYIEPDGSLEPGDPDDGSAEIVSPPMPVNKALAALNNMYQMASDLNLYTNESTGLHINMSVPGEIDILKLAVFVGDQYVLQQFGREDSPYALSLLRSIQQHRPHHGTVRAMAQAWTAPEVDLEEKIAVLRSLANNYSDDHMASVSDNGNYISFRHAGGNYLGDRAKIENTVGRFARAIMIASDPNAYRDEYLKKITKLIQPMMDKLAKERQSVDVDIGTIRKIVAHIRVHGVPAIQYDIADVWDRIDWDDVPYSIMRITDVLPFHKVKPRNSKQAALDTVVQQNPGGFSVPNPQEGKDYFAGRFVLIPKTWQGILAVQEFTPVSTSRNDHIEIIRIPLNNTKAREVLQNLRDVVEQSRKP